MKPGSPLVKLRETGRRKESFETDWRIGETELMNWSQLFLYNIYNIMNELSTDSKITNYANKQT